MLIFRTKISTMHVKLAIYPCENDFDTGDIDDSI